MAMAWAIMPPAEAPMMPIAMIEQGMDGTDDGHFTLTAQNGIVLIMTAAWLRDERLGFGSP